MNKYIDAEKLKSEIKLRREKLCERYLDVSEDANLEYDVLSEILNIIESHQQEQLEVDFEKELQKHIEECLDVKFPTTDIEEIKKDVAYTARKFYELGLNTRKEG